MINVGNWVVDKLVCLQEYYLNLKLMGSILYGMIVLILLVFIVKSLYYQRHEIMAMVLAVTGEVILGAPAIVKLVFELGGWNNFSKDILVKYIVYCVVILLLSVISILRFYKKDSILGDVFSIVIGEIMLGVPFILELLLANNVFDGIVVFLFINVMSFLYSITITG